MTTPAYLPVAIRIGEEDDPTIIHGVVDVPIKQDKKCYMLTN